MARLRPTEVKAIVALLDEPAEDVEELAKDILRTLDRMRKDREHWLVRLNLAGEDGTLGPYPTQGAALRAVESMIGVQDERYVGRMVPPSLLDEVDTVPPRAYCVQCHHPMVAHSWPKARVSGCVVGFNPKRGPSSGCQCGR